MAGNTFGQLFRISTFGESHGVAIGVIIDGCPANLAIDIDFIQQELDKRRPGQSQLTTQRKESDTVQILSGVFEGKSTGTPICLLTNTISLCAGTSCWANTGRPKPRTAKVMKACIKREKFMVVISMRGACVESRGVCAAIGVGWRRRHGAAPSPSWRKR